MYPSVLFPCLLNAHTYIDCVSCCPTDIVANLPEELALHLLSFLDLPSVIACSRVSRYALNYTRDLICDITLCRTWHRLVEDNAIWRELFLGRKPDGWAIDTRRARSLNGKIFLPAPLAIDWHEVYRTRAELDRRWMATSKLNTKISEEDKENAKAWEPSIKKIVGHMDRYATPRPCINGLLIVYAVFIVSNSIHHAS